MILRITRIIIVCVIESCSWWDVLDTILCDEVCQWLAAGLWVAPGTPVSSTNKIDHHNITEILLKVAHKHHKPSPNPKSVETGDKSMNWW
jgi:hypothetical protein